MEHYATAPGAQMIMRQDPVLTEQLVALILAAEIDIAIETGTFLGEGSTRFVAECFRRTTPPKRFVTVELLFQNWCRAKANLRPYAFVDCRWGSTVDIAAALRFLATDDALVNHRNYHGIYIDDTEDPVAWYSRELRGQLAFSPSVEVSGDARNFLWDGENLLTRLLETHRDHRPLVILDSAGGIGWLEFQILLREMAARPFFLLIDDTHHLKHFRSLEHIRRSPDFRLIGEGASWALASHLSPGFGASSRG
jgi:hypothetical protein